MRHENKCLTAGRKNKIDADDINRVAHLKIIAVGKRSEDKIFEPFHLRLRGSKIYIVEIYSADFEEIPDYEKEIDEKRAIFIITSSQFYYFGLFFCRAHPCG